MPIKDRLASLKRSNATKGEAQVMSELIIATEEEETTEQFLRRITSVREAITEMEAVVNLIRQLHNLLKISNQTRDVDRRFYDEVRQTSDKKSAYYRMRKDQDGVDNDHDPSSRRLSRGVEISDVEKGNGAELMTVTANGITAPTLECTEIDEEDDKSAEKAALLEIKQRNEELQLLEEAVSKVNAMHEHLNFLVHTQNPIMDRIDTNISSAVEYTTKVMNDTKQAVDLSDEARQKQFLVFFLIGILIFMLVLMIITLIKVWVPGLQ
ncbi:SNARE domain protein [Necator americanus]|uniref:SNARE domain protein n=1 Tax=Necator americanus TaxID=51031 RepID=W2SXB4_NECAM|nr:SNARE domain protein [Necator americanus]ETN74399.1 SNARE domain protein [Necator americanus]